MTHPRYLILLTTCLLAGGSSLCLATDKIEVIREKARTHWAFQPIKKTQDLKIEDTRPELASHGSGLLSSLLKSSSLGAANPIDSFILAKLQQNALAPAPEADRRILARRLFFDLIGLPPSPDEVDAFVNDSGSDAYERLVDRLLRSPHHGERWGRHWLDVARYSDSKGYVYAREQRMHPHAAVYRDWVIRSLNDDMPYDRFVMLQLAADQLAPHDPSAQAALGFLTLGQRFLAVTPDIIDDRIDVIGRGLMGLTISCARCHDHKYDPVPTADYYSLYGVFQSTHEKEISLYPEKLKDNAEYQALLQKLREGMKTKREEAAANVRARVADYLLAQLNLAAYPLENFSQILNAEDLKPPFVHRWRLYLEQRMKADDPVFATWYGAREGKPFTVSNKRVAAAFETPAQDFREAVQRYATLFADVEREWKELLKTAKDNKQEPPARLLDNDSEALRLVLHDPNSPCEVPDVHMSNIEWFFDNSVCGTLWKLQNDLDKWIIDHADAPHVMVLTDNATPARPRIFKRGNAATPEEEVPRQLPEVLAGMIRKPFTQGSGRLELAQAISSRNNPLTARVIVNRVWMHHFGRGLVNTPSDFGLRAEPPTHPELLDWLAAWFMDQGWSLKKLHRLIVTSQTWRQSSGPSVSEDVENKLLARMVPQRLDWESLRDSMLFVGGQLDARQGGASVDLFKGTSTRRSVYGTVDRQYLPSVLRMFDFANPDLHAPQRHETSVPQQALFLMNHPLPATEARAIAKRSSAIPDAQSRVKEVYRILFQRAPSEDELVAATSFIAAALREPNTAANLDAWSQLAQVLLLSNEFMFVD